MNTRQYATVTIPPNQVVHKAVDRTPRSWPTPIVARLSRAVVVNQSKGTFRALTPEWYFVQGPYMYYLTPWDGIVFTHERFGIKDFVSTKELK